MKSRGGYTANELFLGVERNKITDTFAIRKKTKKKKNIVFLKNMKNYAKFEEKSIEYILDKFPFPVERHKLVQ